MTREEELRRLIATAQKVSETALEQGDHNLALQALLSAFLAIADANPCCTEMAARLARNASDHLHQIAVARVPPASQRVH